MCTSAKLAARVKADKKEQPKAVLKTNQITSTQYVHCVSEKTRKVDKKANLHEN